MPQVNAAIAAGTWPSPPPITYGSLYSWGLGSSGQLGLGNTTSYSLPKQIGSLVNWTATGKANLSSFAIKTDGTLWSWGSGLSGSLGLNNTTNYSSPKQVGALTTWLYVSGSYYSAAAIKTDGTLWSWGKNNYGQLGLGNITDYSSPKQIGTLATWLSLACGYGNGSMFATKTNGTLWAWGYNGYGQLGLGNTTYAISSPQQIGLLTNWLSVAMGQQSTLAIKTDGTLWSWGNGGFGSLGLNNTTNYSSPKQVGALTTWLNIAKGVQGQALATKNTGTLWAWGYNNFGQSGLGNTVSYSSPTQVGALTNWLKVSGGLYSSAAIKTDGTLWGWGRNNYGQLGLGNATNYSSPKQVGALTNWYSINSQFGYVLAISI